MDISYYFICYFNYIYVYIYILFYFREICDRIYLIVIFDNTDS